MQIFWNAKQSKINPLYVIFFCCIKNLSKPVGPQYLACILYIEDYTVPYPVDSSYLHLSRTTYLKMKIWSLF